MASEKAPIIDEACERISAWLAEDMETSSVPGEPDDVIFPLEVAILYRRDLVALVTHCGWNVTSDQVRVDTPVEPVVEVHMFAGGGS